MIGVTTIQTILYHLPPSNLDFVRVHCAGNLKYGGFLTPGTSKSSILIGFSIINRPILRKPVSPSDGCWNSCDVGWCVAHVGTLGVSLKVGYPPVVPLWNLENHQTKWKLENHLCIIYTWCIFTYFPAMFHDDCRVPNLHRFQELLGYALKKDRRCCLSDWSASELSIEQAPWRDELTVDIVDFTRRNTQKHDNHIRSSIMLHIFKKYVYTYRYEYPFDVFHHDFRHSSDLLCQVEYAALDAWVTLRLFYLDGYFW